MYMSSGTGSPRPGAIALALGSALTLGLLAGACFNPPAGAVQFACDPAGDAACPDGYECRADGCCHREGTEGDDGACKLGVSTLSASGGGGTGSTGAPATDSDVGGSGGPESTGTGDASTSSATTTSDTTAASDSTTSGSTG